MSSYRLQAGDKEWLVVFLTESCNQAIEYPDLTLNTFRMQQLLWLCITRKVVYTRYFRYGAQFGCDPLGGHAHKMIQFGQDTLHRFTCSYSSSS